MSFFDLLHTYSLVLLSRGVLGEWCEFKVVTSNAKRIF